MVVRGILLSLHALTSMAPGSQRAGVPPSLKSPISLPSAKSRKTPSSFSVSLNK